MRFSLFKPEALIIDSERWISLIEDAADESATDGAGECNAEDSTQLCNAEWDTEELAFTSSKDVEVRDAADSAPERVSCSCIRSTMLDARLEGRCFLAAVRALDLFCNSCVSASMFIWSRICSESVGMSARTVYDTSSCVFWNLRLKLNCSQL